MTTNIPAPAFGAPPAPAFAPPPAPATVPGPAPYGGEGPTMEMLVQKYRDLRDKKAEITKRHDEELRPYAEALAELNSMLLDLLNRSGADSVKTKAGTAYKQTRESYTVKDPAIFREWCRQNNGWDLLATAVSKEAIESLLASGGALPPGLGVNSAVVLGVRK